jgi:hypothetical protein
MATIACPPGLDSDSPAKQLAAMVESVNRFHRLSNLTVCLEMIEGSVPSYVVEAIHILAESHCVNVIVIAGDASTHQPGPLLGDDVREAVSKAQTGGTIWHPLQNKRVMSDPLHPLAASKD